MKCCNCSRSVGLLVFAALVLLVAVPAWVFFFSGTGPAIVEEQKKAEVSVTNAIPTDLTEIAELDPVAALEMSLRRYNRDVRGYTCRMIKQELLQGKLRSPETIRCSFREEPFSVLMEWEEGKVDADSSLFVKGEHGNNLLIRPTGFKFRALRLVDKYFVERHPEDKEVKAASRYSVWEFGIERGTNRTYTAWKKVGEDPARPKPEYRGIEVLKEAGNRPCHVLRRKCDPPEEDGLTEITVWLDVENFLQVGSVLKAGENLIGKYYFRDIVLNPEFTAGHFSPDVLKK